VRRTVLLALATISFTAIVIAGVEASRPQVTSPFDALREMIPQHIDPARATQRAKSPAVVASSRPQGPRRLTTGFGDFHFTSSNDGLRRDLLDAAKNLNASVVRLYVRWRSIAPTPRPPGFAADDPNSPGYDWDPIDRAVDDARSRGLRPVLLVNLAPDWAEGKDRPSSLSVAPAGTWKPNPSDVADFGTAIAKRYKGRSRDYLLWNEPNLPGWLSPQTSAPSHYRSMLNAFYDAVHRVDDKNRVITAGTAPYGGLPNPGMDPTEIGTRPLEFWREVMCVEDNRKLSPTNCRQKPKFDVLAHHPLNTSGGPWRSAINDDDVSTPDLKNLVSVLRAAERAGNIKPDGHRPVWATEIWWETNPPDPSGSADLDLQAKWYAEALYVLWRQGASLVLFYQVRDDVYNGIPGLYSYETGVQFADGTPKLSSRAVQFPFVADRKTRQKVYLWGKAPRSGKLTVKAGKRRVTSLRVKAGKTFSTNVRLRGKHKLHAEVGNLKSVPWLLR
jgi:hypothetical protein